MPPCPLEGIRGRKSFGVRSESFEESACLTYSRLHLNISLFRGFCWDSPQPRLMKIFWRTPVRMRLAMVAISFMLGLGYVTRYSGLDALLGQEAFVQAELRGGTWFAGAGGAVMFSFGMAVSVEMHNNWLRGFA
jgi:hypothetical protein